MMSIRPISPWFNFSEFVKEVNNLHKYAMKKTIAQIVDELPSLSRRVKSVERVGKGKFLVREEMSEAISKRKISPSLFNTYRYCARKLFIELMSLQEHGGVIVSEDQLRAMYRGLLVHKIWAEKYASGMTEFRVEDDIVVGYIDEYRPEIPMVIEIKSGFSIDRVAVSLQCKAYAKALRNTILDRDPMIVVVNPREVFEVTVEDAMFEEYVKRLSKIVELALKRQVELIPPRLTSNLASRCDRCPYRAQCLDLPSPVRSWNEYFKIMGFEYLKPRTSQSQPL